MSLTPRQSLVALVVVCLATLPAPLDSAVNIAFPRITEAFVLDQAGIRWVIISYVLTYASLTLVFGKAGDLFGHRRVFVTGLMVAAAGFLACALARQFELLLMGRVLQGIGIALTWSCAPALATSFYAPSERTRIIGIYSAAIAVGTALGPLAGGMLVERFGWPVVFWGRLPLVLAGLALAWAIPAAGPPNRGRAFDWMGAVLLVACLAASVLAAARPPVSRPEVLTAVLLGIAACAGTAFLYHESRCPDPIIRPSLFRDRTFLVLNLASIAVNLAGFAVMLLVPFHLARTAQLPAGVAGLVLGANACGIVLGSSFAGRVGRTVGALPLAIAGSMISAAGLGMVSSWHPATPVLAMGACLALQGLGLGIFQVAYADRVLATLPEADRGVAGSLTLLTRTLGVIGAATGLSALARQLEGQALLAGIPDPALVGFTTTFRWVSLALGCSSSLALAAGLLRKRKRLA